MEIRSRSFEPNGVIPVRHTCEGSDRSPPLEWSGAPSATQSLALIMDDPDVPDPTAPRRVWVHWVIYNLLAQTSALDEGMQQLPAGTLDGRNDWGRIGYGGPCPPIGRRRYFFKLYALDAVLPDLRQPTRAALETSMQDHVLATAELVGTYQKANR